MGDARRKMFPFRDHNPSEKTPFVTIGLIVVNILIFLGYWQLASTPRALDQFFFTYGLVPVVAFSDPVPWVTSMFLHGGLMHLGGNMLFLWVFGDNLEDEMGHIGFLLFYLASGLGAALFQVLADPVSMVPMVGASGAIAGVMGGYILLYPRARVDIVLIIIIILRVIPVPAWLVLGLWFGLQLFSGISAQGAGVAYWAHAGGFFVGFLLTLPLWARLGGTAYWKRTHGHPPHPETSYRTGRTSIPSVRRK